MLSREQSIANFVKNIDELVGSNYILADKKISILLKGVSCSKMFFELFEHCTKDFDYEDAKRRYISHGTGYNSGRFVLPQDSKSIIAFVLLLLFEIDSKKLDFLYLLETVFHEDGYNESFKRFAKEAIVPFKNEVLYAVSKMVDGASKYENPTVAVKKLEKPVLSDQQSMRIIELLNQSKAIILQYKMDDYLKAELLALYDDFSSALYGTSRERLKLSFLGYKYSTLYHRKLDVSVGEIEKILYEYKILDENY